MAKDVLHIKSHTEGTSNELSFDVLDAASKQLDNQKKSKFPKAGIAIPRGPKAQSATSKNGTASVQGKAPAELEIDRRKKKRRSRTFWLHFVVAFLLIGGTVAAVWYGTNIYKEKQNYAAHYTALVNQLVEVDSTLVELDSVMADPAGSISTLDMSEIRRAASTTMSSLETIRKGATNLQGFTSTDRDVAALEQMLATVDGRKEMADCAYQAISIVETSNQQVQAANEAWGEVVKADQTAREASDEANEALTQEATIAAREKTREALVGFEDARDRLERIRTAEPEIDLSAQIAYLDKRIEAMEYAIATSDSLLDGDRDAARENNDLYNAAEEEAARMAADLPPSLGQIVESVYGGRLEQVTNRYNTARLAVSEADSNIRDYLGELGK